MSFWASLFKVGEAVAEASEKVAEGAGEALDKKPELEVDDLPEGMDDCADNLPELPDDLDSLDVDELVSQTDENQENLLRTDKAPVDDALNAQEPQNNPDVGDKANVSDGGDDILKNGNQFDENGKLKPNITYETENGCKYTTDEQGRIIKVEGQLELGEGKRNNQAQREAGGEDRKSGDHGGHLIAHIFKGSGELDNIVAMDGSVNLNAYKKLETVWKKALEEGKEVFVKIEPVYEGDSKRPVAFKISYTIDGEKIPPVVLENTKTKDS